LVIETHHVWRWEQQGTPNTLPACCTARESAQRRLRRLELRSCVVLCGDGWSEWRRVLVAWRECGRKTRE